MSHTYAVDDLLRGSREMNRAEAHKTTLRLPRDVTDWLRSMAAHNVSSMTTELVRAVRDRMAHERRADRKAEVTVD
jgi:hypothetical protein